MIGVRVREEEMDGGGGVYASEDAPRERGFDDGRRHRAVDSRRGVLWPKDT